MKKQLLLLCLSLAGCTSQATRQAISNYELAEVRKQEAFDNVLRIANEQMAYSLITYIKEHPDKAVEAVKATWGARSVLETARMQYQMGRSFSRLTVGQYLYDQQGWLNALLESNSKDLARVSDGIEAGNKAAGVQSAKELIPTTLKPETKSKLFDLLDQYQQDDEAAKPRK